MNGARILVTRPLEQAHRLVAQIAALGGVGVAFPAIEISAIPREEWFAPAVAGLASGAAAIFVSANAVRFGAARLVAAGALPGVVALIAVGTGTEHALRGLGLDHVSVPSDGADSEAVLRLSCLQRVSGRRVLIFRGLGGREHLARALSARGAEVCYVQCYERSRPEVSPRQFAELWREPGLDAVAVASVQALVNLFHFAGAELGPTLKRTLGFAGHPRIATTARSMGMERVIATAPGDAALLDSLVAHFGRAAHSRARPGCG